MKCLKILSVSVLFAQLCSIITVHGSVLLEKEAEREDLTTERVYQEMMDDVVTETYFDDFSTTEIDYVDVENATVQPTQQQQEIINELQHIWDIKEKLKSNNITLKTSLESLVHLSFARMQTEPEETLDQLKYLLSMLRRKLSVEESDLSNSYQQRAKRSPLLQMEEYAHSESEKTRKLGSVENLLPIREVSPIMNDVVSDLLSKSALTKEQTIHKLLMVKDYITSLEPTNEQNKNEQNHSPIGEAVGKYVNSGTLSSVTAEQLANSIINLLNRGNSLQNNASGFTHTSTTITNTSPSSVLIPILTLHETSEPFTTERIENLINDEDIQYFKNYLLKIKQKQEHKNKIKSAMLKLYQLPATTPSSTTTSTPKTPLPLPSYLYGLTPVGGLITEPDIHEDIAPETIEMTTRTSSNLKSKYQRRKTTTTSASHLEEYDYLLESTDTETSEENIDGQMTVVPTPTFAQIMTEMSSGHVMITPISVFNGTREAASLFLALFERLSFPVKMITLFILSVSILTISLGIYSLGPPILAVGALGILIPIVLFILFRTDDSKRLSSSTLDLEKQDEMAHDILDLIDNAIKMYT